MGWPLAAVIVSLIVALAVVVIVLILAIIPDESDIRMMRRFMEDHVQTYHKKDAKP